MSYFEAVTACYACYVTVTLGFLNGVTNIPPPLGGVVTLLHPVFRRHYGRA